jgi:hypothetical protein
MYRASIFVLFVVFSLFNVQAQKFYRIKGDFSIKTKLYNGTSQLVIGKVYYDRNIKKLVYQNSFPAVETWVSFDTTVYCIVNNKVTKRITSPPLSQFSIFHLALTSQINNYGLKNTMFKIQKVEKQNSMVITTWLAPFQFSKIFGKVLISNVSNKLYGIVFLDQKGQVLRKQFFNNYQNISGLEFPLEIIDISYVNGKENYQVTTYKNIEVDKISEDNMYNYIVPQYN